MYQFKQKINFISPLVETDFQDVKLKLNDISYMPYRKYDKNIMCINKNLSHQKI